MAARPGGPRPEPTPRDTTTRQKASANLPGIGATRSEWDATHQAVAGYVKGSAYGPTFVLPATGERSVTYAGVASSSGGRIDGYTVNLQKVLPFAAAVARATAELPADATRVQEKRASGCRALIFTSPTLEGLFSNETHRGRVLVIFTSRDSERFTPDAVTAFDVMFDLSPESDPC